MKFQDYTRHYTDGFYNAELHSHRRGYSIRTFYKGEERSCKDFLVAEYGSRKRCLEEARRDLKNDHFTEIIGG